VALAALVLYPDVSDKSATYVMVIKDIMPAGLLGLLMAAFLAAYMSTISTQTNWGTSYIINDLFRPYVNNQGDERYYVKVSRVTTVILLVLSFLVTTQFDQISDAWRFILACSGGIGLVLILRWFWWRINAWSEISAMLAPYLVYPFLKAYTELSYEWILIIIVIWSTFVWVLVTFLTKPTEDEKLRSFYRRVHPGGRGWRKISAEMPDVKGDTGYGRLFISWLAGSAMIMSTLFGIGRLIFAEYTSAIVYFVIAALATALIIWQMNKLGWRKTIR
jgi:Na+/proline symporter